MTSILSGQQKLIFKVHAEEEKRELIYKIGHGQYSKSGKREYFHTDNLKQKEKKGRGGF